MSPLLRLEQSNCQLQIAMLTQYLLVPGLFEPPDSEISAHFPNLDMLLSRSDHVVEKKDNFESLLCSHFDVGPPPNQDLPSASLMLSGEGGEPQTDSWAVAAPVRLHVDRDRLLLFPLSNEEFEKSDVDRLREAFNQHFRDDGVELITDFPRHWYLRLQQPRELTTSSLAQVAGRTLDPFLPGGADAAWLRGLMNESQMLLHSQDIPALNSLWIWGVGQLPEAVHCHFGELSGDNPLLLGLQANTVSGCRGEACLMVKDASLQAVQSGDQQQWLQAMEDLDATIEELLKALSNGKIRKIILQDGSGNSFHYRSFMRLRLWRSHFNAEQSAGRGVTN
ncbi:MAG TPA: hypothetical protein DDW45_09805 [Gammaproteobacteria bacterium]|nr:hypothetical protein [Gammaproteobacteria bacterium]